MKRTIELDRETDGRWIDEVPRDIVRIRKDSRMPHPPNDVRPDGTCRVCGDRLSAHIRRRGVTKIYRRHLSNPDRSTKGNGEPIR
jgi:Ni/Co efflux regulator RcnB